MVGYLNTLCCKFTSVSTSERILKIGLHLGKLWEIFGVLFFLTQSVVETGAVETALYYVNEQ